MFNSSLKAESNSTPLASLYGLWKDYEFEMPNINGAPEAWQEEDLKLAYRLLRRCMVANIFEIPVMLEIVSNPNFQKQVVWLQNYFFMNRQEKVGPFIPMVEKILKKIKSCNLQGSPKAYFEFKKFYLERLLERNLCDSHLTPEMVMQRIWVFLPDCHLQRVASLSEIYWMVADKPGGSHERFYILDHQKFIDEVSQSDDKFDAEKLVRFRGLFYSFEKIFKEIISSWADSDIDRIDALAMRLKFFLDEWRYRCTSKNLNYSGVKTSFNEGKYPWFQNKAPQYSTPEITLDQLDQLLENVLRLFGECPSVPDFLDNLGFIFDYSSKQFPILIAKLKKKFQERTTVYPPSIN